MIMWDNCILWLGYPLKNNIWPDLSKHNNNGVLSGVVWKGDSLWFDGIDDNVNCGNDTVFDITAEITLEAWIKLDSKTALSLVISKRILVPVSVSYEILYHQVVDRFMFQVYDGAWKTATDTISPVVGVWYHIIGIMDGTNLIIYRDTVKTVGDAIAALPVTVADVVIGSVSGGGGAPFPGKINLVRIYNTALTDEQIKESYEQTYRLI